MTTDQRDGGTADGSTPLRGSRCRGCGNVAYPAASGCQRCGSADLQVQELGRHGTVWAHTVQRFAPKSPPYVPPPGGFVPFAVGYVELPDGVRVEALLGGGDLADPASLAGAQVVLVGTEPVPRFALAGTQVAAEDAQ